MSSLLKHCHGKKTHFSRNEKRTINPLTYPLANLSTPQLVHSLTCPLVNLSTRPLAKYCQLYGKKFNTMSAPFIHQLLTLPQKIDSREGLFRCQIG